MTTLFLTFNLFLHNWHTDEGEVWGILQPHVVDQTPSATFDSFYDWVKNSSVREKSDFTFWRQQPCQQGSVVPVPFPDKSVISVRLYTDENNYLPAPQPNDLANLAWILDTNLLEVANIEPQLAEREWKSADKRTAGQPCPALLTTGPFALGYNSQLREAADCAQDKTKGDGDLLRLPGMLQLAFWGGRRQRVPRQCLKNGSLTNNVLQLPRTGDEGDVILTSLHSLLGLTFKLGDKKQQNQLLKVIRLEFEINGTVVPSGAKPDGKPNEQRLDVSGFFGTVDDEGIGDPSAKLSVPGIEDRSHVAYVRQGFLSLQHIIGTPYFQIPVARSSLGSCNPQALKSNAWTIPTRFVARASAVTQKDALTWQAFMAFDGVLKRYRLAPVRANEPHKGRTILQFVPNERAAFYSYLENKSKNSEILALFKTAHLLTASTKDAKNQTIFRPIDRDDGFWFLGLYDLPWDRSRVTSGETLSIGSADKTLVLVGDAPQDQNVRFLFPEGNSFSTDFLEEDAKTKLDNTPRSPNLGDRWEWQASAQNVLPQSEFNVVRLNDGISQDAVSLSADLAPSLCFASLLEFDFAQCIGAMEGKIDIKYPPRNPDSPTASETIVRDLLNYNALVVQRDGRRENPFGQILPTQSSLLSLNCQDSNGAGVQSFEFRFEPPTDAPIRYKLQTSKDSILPARYRENPTNAREFFKLMYKQMGGQNVLNFGLEHTLGPHIALGKQATMSIPAFADFPVAMPAEVVLHPEADKKRNDDNIPFLQISCNMSPTSPQVKLLFQTQWLRDSEFASDSHRVTHIAACRAVAELAYAESVMIKPRIYTFNYRHALEVGSQGRLPSELGGGLIVFENPGWDCTEELGRLCSGWLDNPSAIDSPTEWNCSKATPFLKDQPDFLFVEFEMVVERDPKTTPPSDDLSRWQLQWRPLPPSLPSTKIDLATDRSVATAFASYLSSLKSKCVVVPAARSSAIEQDFVAGAAAILGTTGGASAGWMFANRNAFLETHQQVEMSATVCPLAFSPLPRHPSLGDDTSEIVNRYMEKLDALLSYDPAWDTAQIQQIKPEFLENVRESFRKREALGKKPDSASTNSARPSLWPVMDAAVNRLFPATADRDDVDAVANSKEGTLRDEVREAVLERLWASPRVFGDAKAFLLTLLQGGSLTQPTGLDSEVVFSRLSKLTDQQRRDNTPRPFTDAIREKDTQHDTLRILEFLDDARYNDEFKLESVERKDLRALLQEGVVKSTAGVVTSWKKLTPGNLKLPSKNATIPLPTREPIVPPAHLYSGYIDALQSAPPDAENIDFNKLAKGIWKSADPSDPTPVASRIVHSEFVPRTTRPDEVWFSMLFWIAGERHKKNGSPLSVEDLTAFMNDTFVLYESDTDWDQPCEKTEPQNETDDEARKKAQDFFNGVLSTDQEKAIPATLDPGNLDRLRLVLESKFEDVTCLNGKQPSVSFRLVHNQDKSSVVWVPHAAGKQSSAKDRYEVVVFAPSISKGPQGPRPRILLLINAKIDLWRPKAFRLLHQRNFSHFDKHFRQEAVAGGTPFAYQKSVSRDFSTIQSPIVVNWRTRPLGVLIQEVLIPRCFPQAPKPEATKFDLSVTVRRQHRIGSLVQAGDGPPSVIFRDLEGEVAGEISSFPLGNDRYTIGNQHPRLTEPIKWFPSDTNDFLVDFQWSSPTNLEFLRLSGLRVQVND